MAVSPETQATILRYFHVEKWRIGTIAHHLGVHHSVIKRVLSEAGIPKARLFKKESMLDLFLPFVAETLKKFPTLTASRLYQMVQTRGYKGGPDHFRHLIALHRPRKATEAYLRLRTLPGEQGQVDWGHFGHIQIGKARRPVVAFVMVLSYSRKVFLRFYLNQQMANFLRGHQAAFETFQGVPRVILYDNLKSAVLERQGDAIRFNPTLLEFAAHYRYEPRPVAVARGNEKGRVERTIRFIRDNFFAAREWKDLADLNTQATMWCTTQADNRQCPDEPEFTIAHVFEKEKSTLLLLPENPYPSDERVEVSVGKTPYIRFDLNDYSVPHQYVRRTLTVLGKPNTVTVLDGAVIIAQHARSYDKAQQIELQEHIAELVEHKKQARMHRGQDRLSRAVPLSAEFLLQAALRHYNLGSITSSLLLLLEQYGSTELEVALGEALLRNVAHPNAVRLALEKRREERHQLPTVSMNKLHDERARNLTIRTHNLGDYDELRQDSKEDKNDDN